MVTILIVLLGNFGCDSDSAVGGILPQIRVESLVCGETEGEFKRERDRGCCSETGVSICRSFLCDSATKCPKRRAASTCFRGA